MLCRVFRVSLPKLSEAKNVDVIRTVISISTCILRDSELELEEAAQCLTAVNSITLRNGFDYYQLSSYQLSKYFVTKKSGEKKVAFFFQPKSMLQN